MHWWKKTHTVGYESFRQTQKQLRPKSHLMTWCVCVEQCLLDKASMQSKSIVANDLYTLIGVGRSGRAIYDQLRAPYALNVAGCSKESLPTETSDRRRIESVCCDPSSTCQCPFTPNIKFGMGCRCGLISHEHYENTKDVFPRMLGSSQPAL